jgi:hypothetical protein
VVPATNQKRKNSSLKAEYVLSPSALRVKLRVVMPKDNDVTEGAVISIRLTHEQHEGLKQLASSEHRTVSQQVRHLVDHAIVAAQEATS